MRRRLRTSLLRGVSSLPSRITEFLDSQKVAIVTFRLRSLLSLELLDSQKAAVDKDQLNEIYMRQPAKLFETLLRAVLKTIEKDPRWLASITSSGFARFGTLWTQEIGNLNCLKKYVTGSVLIEKRGDIHNAYNFDPTEPGFRRPVLVVQADSFNRSQRFRRAIHRCRGHQ